MSFDEEHIDPHGECAAEIHRLQSAIAELERERDGLKAQIREPLTLGGWMFACLEAREDRDAKAAEAERLRAALASAIHIADEAALEWDSAPAGMRAGKILLALAGKVPGYRQDTDEIHRVLLEPSNG